MTRRVIGFVPLVLPQRSGGMGHMAQPRVLPERSEGRTPTITWQRKPQAVTDQVNCDVI